IQPAFDVPAYFGELERAGRRGRVDGTGSEQMLFGYPRPHPSLQGRADVTGSLRRLTGTAVAIEASIPGIGRRSDSTRDPGAAGPVGAVVSLPDVPPSASVVIVGGIGGRRSGINRIWTRTAWYLAREGFAVLRMDYPGRGESALAIPRPSTDALIVASAKWFL